MLPICLYCAVNGNQIQLACVFLIHWNYKKIYVIFVKNKILKIVKSVLMGVSQKPDNFLKN